MYFEKVMYKRTGRQQYKFAIPRNLKELKALIWDKYCIMDKEKLIHDVLHKYYLNAEWYDEDEYDHAELLDIFVDELDFINEINIKASVLAKEDYDLFMNRTWDSKL